MEKKTEQRIEDMAYEYWFAGIKNLSTRKKYLIREHMKTGRAVYYIEETKINKLPFLDERDRKVLLEAKHDKNIQESYKILEEKEIRFVPWFAPEYPERLLELPDFPYALYVKGSLPSPDGKKAAIVGARKCTPYGEKYALEFGCELARAGVEIISGLARGIDGMGQRGALIGRGKTFAVLGCGVDICYPREHIGFYSDILEQGGGILSELLPGTPPLSKHFPARNRIISGLADAVLVIEARERSGSLITADQALDQGRDVFALPGPINSPLSTGCNQLIRQGAGLLISPEMLLEEWNLPCQSVGRKEPENKKMLESREKWVYSRLGLYPKNVDQLVGETDMEVRELMSLLVSLELKGYIREISKNYYISVQ